MESSKNVLSISVENPMVIPLSLSSVMYTQYIPVFILLFFRFDDDAKLKKRDSGDVSYSKKKCFIFGNSFKSDKYRGEGEPYWLFPLPLLSLSELLPYLLFFGDGLIFRGRHAIVGSEATVESGARIEARLVFHLIDV